MTIREALKKITEQFPEEHKKSTSGNPLYLFIRDDVPQILKDVIGHSNLANFHVKG